MSQVPNCKFAQVARITLLSALLGTAGACGQGMGPGGPGGQPGAEAGKPEEKATPVRLTTLSLGDIESRVSSASTIEAEQRVTVHAESTGRLTRVAYEEGDEVEAGKVLARVRRDAQASGLDRADANYEKIAADVERIERLVANGVASQEELANAKAQLRAASIDKRDRRRDLANTNVVAPFAGTVTQRFINEGGFVSAGQQVYEITDFATLVARVYVPERELDRIAVGQEAQVVGKAAAGRSGIGKVMRIAPIVDATTGTVKVTIALPPELAGGENGFLPGMYAEVTLTTDRHEGVLLVPKSALIYEEERVFAFTVEEGKAKRVLLEVGLADDEWVEVISGLEEGSEVIIAGQNGLEDGAKVEVVTEELKVGPVGGDKGEATADAAGVGDKDGDEKPPAG